MMLRVAAEAPPSADAIAVVLDNVAFLRGVLFCDVLFDGFLSSPPTAGG